MTQDKTHIAHGPILIVESPSWNRRRLPPEAEKVLQRAQSAVGRSGRPLEEVHSVALAWVCLAVSLFVCLPLCLSVSLSVCLCLSVCLSVSLSLCLFVSLSVCVAEEPRHGACMCRRVGVCAHHMILWLGIVTACILHVQHPAMFRFSVSSPS